MRRQAILGAIFILLVVTANKSFASAIAMTAEGKLHNLLLNGIAGVQVPATAIDCGDPSCAEVNRTGFSSQDVMAVLQKSPAASALIKSLDPAPEFKYFEDLTPAQTTALRSSAETKSEADADFVPQGILDKDHPVVLVHKKDPLYLAVILASHELQHAADEKSAWAKSIDDDWKQMNLNNGVLDSGNRPDPHRKKALFDLFTYISEYRAYATDSQVRRELIHSYPCIDALWAQHIQSNPMGVDIDPVTNPSHRKTILMEYISPEDYLNLKNELNGFEHSKKLSDEINQTGIKLEDLRNALKDFLML